MKKLRQIPDSAVFDPLRVSPRDQQPGLIALRQRMLSDKFRRQFVVVVGEFVHAV